MLLRRVVAEGFGGLGGEGIGLEEDADLVNAGLMHAPSTKYVVALVAATSTAAATYTLTGQAPDCTGINF